MLRELDGVRQDGGAAGGAALRGERGPESGERLGIVGTIEQGALVEERGVGPETNGAVDVAGASQHVVTIACAACERLELLEVDPRIRGGRPRAAGARVPSGARRHAARARHLHPASRARRVDRARAPPPCVRQRSDHVRGIALTPVRKERGDRAGTSPASARGRRPAGRGESASRSAAASVGSVARGRTHAVDSAMRPRSRDGAARARARRGRGPRAIEVRTMRARRPRA